ncbi:MAG: hypothetical protein ABI367_02445 [Mucilaginibacter sp.]
MRKSYPRCLPLSLIILYLLLFVAACKKDKTAPQPPPITNYAKLGLYELISTTNRRVFIPITKIGTVSINYASIFDTGSTGMTIDATNILPASMITSSGIIVPGDSVVYNGITVTSQQSTISYGGAGGSITTEYGNLAYAPVTIGDANGNITTGRIPIFLYYKAQDVTNNKTLIAHSNDVFGVGPGTSFASSAIGSPLSYFTLPTSVTSGFRLGMFQTASFTTGGTYVPGLLVIGLTPDDLNSSGFIMHNLNYYSQGGYSPNIPATINYNGTDVSALLLFDTGNPSVTFVENEAASANTLTLPANTIVSLTTSSGFTYQYTTTSNYNLTQVLRPSYSGDPRSIFSIDFFLSNEYLMDYQNHRIGLKNN